MSLIPDISPGFRQRFDEARNGGGGAFSFGNALEFDNVNDKVTWGGIVSLGNYTFSGWMKMGADITGPFWITDVGLTQWIQNWTNTQIRVKTGSVGVFDVPQFITNVWYHIFVVRNTTTRVWLNGVESTSGAQDSGTAATNWGVTSDVVFHEKVLDEFAYWDGVVGTEANAIALYNGGAGALASDIIAAPNRYYQFNESSGTVLTDIGSDLADGTLTNFADPDSNWQAH